MKSQYRQGIIAVIMNSNSEVLLFERSDHAGAWQFPQGGIEKGESEEEALFRELLEEIGTCEVEILKKSELKTRYQWPRTDRRLLGQEHTWFLCRLKVHAKPDLAKSDQCFINYKWMNVQEVPNQSIEWKKESITAGLKYLGLI